MKALILDSGILINFSMNGLLDVLEKLKESFDGKFIITEYVKYETIDRPSSIMKYELGALRIKELLDKGVLEMPESLGLKKQDIEKGTEELMDIANHYLKSNNGWIKIVSEGEMSCLAVSDELTRMNIENIIGVDERTTRILAEKPENLGQIISDKLNEKVELVAKDLNVFRKYKFIRSSEIAFVAYKKGLIKINGKEVLEALLYATKFHGTAISEEEIKTLEKL